MKSKVRATPTKGQGLVEYLILICLVAVSTIAIVSVVGANIRELYAKVSLALQGKKEQIPFTQPNKDTYRRRGMGNFEESTESNEAAP